MIINTLKNTIRLRLKKRIIRAIKILRNTAEKLFSFIKY